MATLECLSDRTDSKVVHVPHWYSVIVVLTALSFECKVVRIPPPHKVTSNRMADSEI